MPAKEFYAGIDSILAGTMKAGPSEPAAKLPPGRHLVSTGEKKEPVHWKDDPNARIVNFGTQQKPKPFEPAGAKFWRPGFYEDVRSKLYGLGSGPSEADTARESHLRRNKMQDSPEYRQVQARIRRDSEDAAAVSRIRQALDRGDAAALKREMDRFPRLHPYRDDL